MSVEDVKIAIFDENIISLRELIKNYLDDIDGKKYGDFIPWTPLQYAVAVGKQNIIGFLIENGADFSIVDKTNRNDQEITDFLEKQVDTTKNKKWTKKVDEVEFWKNKKKQLEEGYESDTSEGTYSEISEDCDEYDGMTDDFSDSDLDDFEFDDDDEEEVSIPTIESNVSHREIQINALISERSERIRALQTELEEAEEDITPEMIERIKFDPFDDESKTNLILERTNVPIDFESKGRWIKIEPWGQKPFPTEKKEILEIIKKKKLSIKHVPKNTNFDKGIVIECLKSNTGSFKDIPKEFQSDVDVMLQLLKFKPKSFKKMTEKLRNDKEFVLKALKLRARYQYISDELKKDREIILASLDGYFHNFYHIDDSLKNDEEILLKAINTYPQNFKMIPKKYKKSFDFIMKSIEISGAVLSNLPHNYRRDHDIIMKFYDFRNDNYLTDELLLSALYYDLPSQGYPSSFYLNKETLLKAVSINPQFINMIEGDFRRDLEILMRAIRFINFLDVEHECKTVDDYLFEKLKFFAPAVIRFNPLILSIIQKRNDFHFNLQKSTFDDVLFIYKN
eukprot:gene4080-7369_t